MTKIPSATAAMGLAKREEQTDLSGMAVKT